LEVKEIIFGSLLGDAKIELPPPLIITYEVT
jgi:hypothetical protein